MADKDGEHRMLFDLRGRRKRLIQVIYAGLAVLMAGGLVLFGIGGEVSGGLLDGLGVSDTTTTDTNLDEQAERLDERLARNPNDEQLLLALVRTRISYANTLVELDAETGQQNITSGAREQYALAAAAWDRYLRVSGGQASPSVALLASNAFYTLAETAPTADAQEEDLRRAVEAQRIVAEQRPNLGTLSTLAIYEYFNLSFEAGDRAAKAAEAEATSPPQRKQVQRQLSQVRKRAKRFQRQQRQFAEAEQGQARERLKNPLGGLSGGGF